MVLAVSLFLATTKAIRQQLESAWTTVIAAPQLRTVLTALLGTLIRTQVRVLRAQITATPAEAKLNA